MPVPVIEDRPILVRTISDDSHMSLLKYLDSQANRLSAPVLDVQEASQPATIVYGILGIHWQLGPPLEKQHGWDITYVPSGLSLHPPILMPIKTRGLALQLAAILLRRVDWRLLKAVNWDDIIWQALARTPLLGKEEAFAFGKSVFQSYLDFRKSHPDAFASGNQSVEQAAVDGQPIVWRLSEEKQKQAQLKLAELVKRARLTWRIPEYLRNLA